MLKLDGTTLVVGLGKSGLSMVRTLVMLGAKIVVADSRYEPPELETLRTEFPEVSCHLGSFNPVVFAGATRLLVSPGVAVATPVVAEALSRDIPVWSDIELLTLLTKIPILAITGSNGKSTVTTLLGKMVQLAGRHAAVCGNLGVPALDFWRIEEMRENAAKPLELYVLELSSFHLETTYNLNARVATVLNISPDHMDRYETLDNYVAAKRRIFRGNGVMVVNADDQTVMSMLEPKRDVLRFTLKEPHGDDYFGLRRIGGTTWLAHGKESWIATSELKIIGYHNIANALAALTMGYAFGLEREAMLAALRDFDGLPHRTTLIFERSGIRWFDDSKGTNVGATVAAVGSLPGKVILIAGGDGKGQDFYPLQAALSDKARCVILMGRDALLIAAALENKVHINFAVNMEQAVELAAQCAQPTDSVLLSPACASFDMFSGYEERGFLFAAAVRRLFEC